MTTWTDTIPLAIPADLIALGNKAAALFDPDTGGAQTFPEANAPIDNPTHSLIRTQLIAEFVPMLQHRDPAIWHPILAQMAEERGREALTLEEVTTLCASLLFDTECDSLTAE